MKRANGLVEGVRIRDSCLSRSATCTESKTRPLRLIGREAGTRFEAPAGPRGRCAGLDGTGWVQHGSLQVRKLQACGAPCHTDPQSLLSTSRPAYASFAKGVASSVRYRTDCRAGRSLQWGCSWQSSTCSWKVLSSVDVCGWDKPLRPRPV